MLKAVCTIGIEGFRGGVCCGSVIVAQKIVDVSSVPAERASPWVGLRFSNLGDVLTSLKQNVKAVAGSRTVEQPFEVSGCVY